MTPEFKYGVISGVGVSLWLAAEYALGLHTAHLEIGEYTGYFSLLIPLLALFLLLKKKQGNGNLDLGSGLVSGLTTAFLASLIVYGFTLGYHQWINPDWVDNVLTLKVAAMRAHQIDESEIRRTITAFRQANSAAGLVTRVIVSLTAIGGIFSVLLTLVMRPRSVTRSSRETA